jgi:hypothetical protein
LFSSARNNTQEVCGEKLEDDFLVSGLGNANEVGAIDLEVKRPCFAFARKFAADVATKYAAGFESVTQSGSFSSAAVD